RAGHPSGHAPGPRTRRPRTVASSNVANRYGDVAHVDTHGLPHLGTDPAAHVVTDLGDRRVGVDDEIEVDRNPFGAGVSFDLDILDPPHFGSDPADQVFDGP